MTRFVLPKPADDGEPGSRAKAVVAGGRYALYGIGALVVLWIIFHIAPFYTVEQNEVAGVTRFGALISDTPVQPGLHFKAPFIDTAHTIRVSIEKIPIPDVKAKTVDNQFVGIDANLSYHTGDPFKALFKVGDMGAEGIADKLIPYVQSRILDEIGKVNALEITDKKSVIEAGILEDIKIQVLELFGESIDDVQITGIHYDPNFEANIQEMVHTRNAQVSAKNTLEVKRTEAEQAVAVATGAANAAVATAEGAKQQAIKAAEAQARQIELMGAAQGQANLAVKTAEAEGIEKVGHAESDVIKLKVTAAGDPATYGNILRAEAAKLWKGDVPKYSFGGGANPLTPMMMVPGSDEK